MRQLDRFEIIEFVEKLPENMKESFHYLSEGRTSLPWEEIIKSLKSKSSENAHIDFVPIDWVKKDLEKSTRKERPYHGVAFRIIVGWDNNNGGYGIRVKSIPLFSENDDLLMDDGPQMTLIQDMRSLNFFFTQHRKKVTDLLIKGLKENVGDLVAP